MEKMMVDKLVFLLSTDWFKPYWSGIGIDIDEAAKTSVQQGCREIVAQILSGTKSYYLASFSDDRTSFAAAWSFTVSNSP
jgi:hypothetical protein